MFYIKYLMLFAKMLGLRCSLKGRYQPITVKKAARRLLHCEGSVLSHFELRHGSIKVLGVIQSVDADSESCVRRFQYILPVA